MRALLQSAATRGRKVRQDIMSYAKGLQLGESQRFAENVVLDSAFAFIVRVMPEGGKTADKPSQIKGKRHQVTVAGPASVMLIQADGPVSVKQ